MKKTVLFSSRIGNRLEFAIEFEGIGEAPHVWNECWGYLWLWACGKVVGRPVEIEMIKTGLDSLVDSVLQAPVIYQIDSSLSAQQALDLVMWARYDRKPPPPVQFIGDIDALAQHEVLPRLTGPFFDGWEAALLASELEERFIYRQEQGIVVEAKWPKGTFSNVVLRARDEFKKLATQLVAVQ